MSFRTRLLLTVAAVALGSLAVLAFGLRREVDTRLSADYARRVAATVSAIEVNLGLEGDEIAERLAALGRALQRDNRFRLAAVAGVESERRYLLDYAGTAITLTGLSMLQIQDDDGRIVSSGHFRNEHGRPASALAERLAAEPDGVIFVTVRAPDRRFMALTRSVELRLGGRRFTLVGGVALDERFLRRLARDREVAVSLQYPGLDVSSDPDLTPRLTQIGSPPGAALAGLGDRLTGQLTVPVLGADGEPPLVAEAHVLVTHTLGPLRTLQRRLDSWFIGTAAATAVTALLLAVWLSSRISRPLADLAEKTAVLDLDRLDIEFEPRGGDEIGTLFRLLGDLTARLKTSARHLREAEHRATVGQMARQVTHDIKNGLIPLRNVFRHLSQVESSDPARLATVFGEQRRGTLDASIDYLETLATNYARLSPAPDRQVCDLNATIAEVVQVSGEGDSSAVRARLADDLPPVVADPVALRRILENLIGNAVDSLVEGHGTVTVTSERLAGGTEGPAVRITVADTGCGMSEAETRNIFTDFYTTKPAGTGLGLSIVRRLVLDLHGTVRVASRPGAGTRVMVEIPAGSSGASPTRAAEKEKR